MQALSPVGRCKSFDATGDGYGRGEGFAAAVLQQYLGSASGIEPFGIVLGSAVNQAGRSSGLTAPNGPSQSTLMNTALAVAGISSADVRFVSVHGTGTALGDPIEIGALATALPAHAQQPYGSSSGPLTLASNKSCYGHTEGAAGLTGLLLAACMAGQQTAPAIMHLRTINPYVAAAVADWGGQGGKRLHLPRQPASEGGSSGQQGGVAGTSSFGMSGVNAHMLVRAAPQGRDSVVPYSVSGKAHCARWFLSARPGRVLTNLSPTTALQAALPFERTRHFCAPAVHPLLVTAYKANASSPVIQCSFSHAAAGYLYDHQVSGRARSECNGAACPPCRICCKEV